MIVMMIISTITISVIVIVMSMNRIRMICLDYHITIIPIYAIITVLLLRWSRILSATVRGVS